MSEILKSYLGRKPTSNIMQRKSWIYKGENVNILFPVEAEVTRSCGCPKKTEVKSINYLFTCAVTWRSFYFNSTIALSGISKTQPYPTLGDPNEVSHILSRINSCIMHPFSYTSQCLKNNNKSVWNSFLPNWLRLVLRGRFSDFLSYTQ
jgi:hypothetical protein